MTFLQRFCFALTLLITPTLAMQSYAQDAKAAIKRPPAKAATKLTGDGRIPPPGPAELPLLPARDFSDSRSLIDLTIPAGWIIIEVPPSQKTEGASLILLEGPGAPAPSCRVILRTPKQPPKIAQAQINKIMYDDRNLQIVRKNLSQGGREVQTLTKINNRGINGLQAKVLMAGSAQRPDVTLLISFFEMVGQSYSFECSTLTADLDNVSADLDTIVKSARLTKS